MMLSFLLFIGATVILLVEGRALLLLTTGHSFGRILPWTLGFPLGVFLNVLLFFLFTLFRIPLLLSTIFIAHAVLLTLLTFFLLRFGTVETEKVESERKKDFLSALFHPFGRRILLVILLLSLAVKLFYGVSHAVLLPTFYYDSLSQWNMRARVSLEDHAIAFDSDERRGVSKPQYPILLHSLQILFLLPQGEWLAGRSADSRSSDSAHLRPSGYGWQPSLREGWKDAIANGATFLLTFSSFLSFFLLLKGRGGTLYGILGFSPFFLIPLATMHLVQGYGDIHVLEYLLLSALLFILFTEGARREFLLLSALFAAAAAWVKQEGLFFGVLPWLMVVSSWFLLQRRGKRHPDLLFGYLPAMLLGSMWTVFLLFKGFPIGAHSGDFSFAFHSEAVRPMLQAFFSFGSFGLAFFVLPLLVPFFLMAFRSWRIFLAPLLILAWGGLAFLLTLFVYFFTPNVEFLLNGQTFSRTMLIPLFLLILGMLLLWGKGLERR